MLQEDQTGWGCWKDPAKDKPIPRESLNAEELQCCALVNKLEAMISPRSQVVTENVHQK